MNLDTFSARAAGELVDDIVNSHIGKAKDVENNIRNAMGILREEGVYAFYLYLLYRESKDATMKVIWKKAARLLSREELRLFNHDHPTREEVIALTENLNNLLLARQLIERYLTYALYGLRSLPDTAQTEGG